MSMTVSPISIPVHTLFSYAFQAEMDFVNKLHEKKQQQHLFQLRQRQIERYEEQQQQQQKLLLLQLQQVQQLQQYQLLQQQKQRLVQMARDDLVKKSKRTLWGDDESEMDFSKPVVYETNDMDLSE
jgi:methionine salvage enolase-phosphatase E1